MIPPDDPRHGTVAGHSAGCRIYACCGLAKWRYDKRRKLAAERGQSHTVPSIGTIRRIRALQALGWAMPQIAEAAGLSVRTIANPTFRDTGSVYRGTHEAIVKAYDELSMRLPEGRYVQRQRNAAKRKGWLPPLAWDDDRIDDPDYLPDCRRTRSTQTGPRDALDESRIQRVLAGENLPTTKAEKVEILRRWLAAGGSEKALCERMGWRPGRYRVREDVAS